MITRPVFIAKCKQLCSRQLLLALLLSVLVHVLLLRELGWPDWMGDMQASSPVLQARLSPVARPQPRNDVPPDSPRRQPPRQRPPQSEPTKEAPVTPDPAAEINPLAPAASEPVADSVDDEAMRAAEIEAWHQDQSQLPAEDAPENATPYQQATTQFALYLNGGSQALGSASIRYAQTDGGQYTLRWEVEGKGLIKLLYPKLVQESRGEIRQQGLRPLFYRYALGSRADRTHEAIFDWDKRLLTLKTEGREDPYDLPQGAQDMLSFMYQFMFVPPLQELHVFLTNGRRFGEYEYEFEGEETLTIGTQTVQTVHLAHTRGDRNEKVDFWLASDYRNLPVKIRILTKNGQVIEQVATSIQAE